MAYLVLFDDHLDTEELRKEYRPAHVEHLKTKLDKIISGGPMFNEAGQACGGAIVLDVDDKAEADAFAANDPYTAMGVHKSHTVTEYRPSFFDGRLLG